MFQTLLAPPYAILRPSISFGYGHPRGQLLAAACLQPSHLPGLLRCANRSRLFHHQPSTCPHTQSVSSPPPPHSHAHTTSVCILSSHPNITSMYSCFHSAVFLSRKHPRPIIPISVPPPSPTPDKLGINLMVLCLSFLPRRGGSTWSGQPKCKDQDGSSHGDDGRTA